MFDSFFLTILVGSATCQLLPIVLCPPPRNVGSPTECWRNSSTVALPRHPMDCESMSGGACCIVVPQPGNMQFRPNDPFNCMFVASCRDQTVAEDCNKTFNCAWSAANDTCLQITASPMNLPMSTARIGCCLAPKVGFFPTTTRPTGTLPLPQTPPKTTVVPPTIFTVTTTNAADQPASSNSTLLIAIVVPIVVVFLIVLSIVVLLLVRSRLNRLDGGVSKRVESAGDGAEHRNKLENGASVGSLAYDPVPSQSTQGYDKVSANPEYASIRGDEAENKTGYGAPPSVLQKEHEAMGDLVIGKQIGAGAHGRVHRGVFKGRDVAIKFLVSATVASIEALRKEAALMSALPAHKHVVQFVGCVEHPSLCLCVEFCSGGSVDVYLRAHKTPQRQLLRWARQAADGVAHLHANNVVHRDLATRNLLLTFDNEVKVGDFGMSRDVVDEGTTRTAVGPIRWMAIESMTSKKYSAKSDAWMFGVTLWEFFSQAALPFADLDPAQVAIAVVKDDLRLPQPTLCPASIYDLMTLCWKEDPSERPDFIQISSELRTAAKHAKSDEDSE